MLRVQLMVTQWLMYMYMYMYRHMYMHTLTFLYTRTFQDQQSHRAEVLRAALVCPSLVGGQRRRGQLVLASRPRTASSLHPWLGDSERETASTASARESHSKVTIRKIISTEIFARRKSLRKYYIMCILNICTTTPQANP